MLSLRRFAHPRMVLLLVSCSWIGCKPAAVEQDAALVQAAHETGAPVLPSCKLNGNLDIFETPVPSGTSAKDHVSERIPKAPIIRVTEIRILDGDTRLGFKRGDYIVGKGEFPGQPDAKPAWILVKNLPPIGHCFQKNVSPAEHCSKIAIFEPKDGALKDGCGTVLRKGAIHRWRHDR
jgi:hypothetical protein